MIPSFFVKTKSMEKKAPVRRGRQPKKPAPKFVVKDEFKTEKLFTRFGVYDLSKSYSQGELKRLYVAGFKNIIKIVQG